MVQTYFALLQIKVPVLLIFSNHAISKFARNVSIKDISNKIIFSSCKNKIVDSKYYNSIVYCTQDNANIIIITILKILKMNYFYCTFFINLFK